MSLKALVLCIFTAMISVGCANAFLPNENRTTYTIEKSDDLYASNVEQFVWNHWQLLNDNVFTYRIVVQNMSSSQIYSMSLRPMLKTEVSSKVVPCANADNKGRDVVLTPGSKILIECHDKI